MGDTDSNSDSKFVHVDGQGEQEWGPQSWRNFPIKQQPIYDDPNALRRAVMHLSSLPGLVHPSEIQKLRRELRECAEGKRFLIVGGDCAERFLDCKAETIEIKLKIILQMSLILISQGGLPVTRIMRIAGQYGKPRS